MTISIGMQFPGVVAKVIINGQAQDLDLGQFLADKKVVLFAVPGAFTGVCSNDHLPTYLSNYDVIISKGVDAVMCLAVNDIPVLTAWCETNQARKLMFISDWNADLTKTLGMDIDLSGFTMGIRSKRYAMVIDKGVVTQLSVEDSPLSCSVSKADAILTAL